MGSVDSLKKKQIAFISWFRLEFEDVEMGGPAMGDCQNDTMMVQNKMILFLQFNKRIETPHISNWCKTQVTGMDAVSTKVVPSTLCGTLTGQHSEHRSNIVLWYCFLIIIITTIIIIITITKHQWSFPSDPDGEGPSPTWRKTDLQPRLRIRQVES